MLDIMTSMNVTWTELDAVWPWSRVLTARESVQHARFLEAWPTAQLTSIYVSANTPKGKRVPDALAFLQPSQTPPSVLKQRAKEQAEKAIYSDAVVRAFSLAKRLGFTGNAHLAAFGVDELRASGWGKTDV